MPKQKPIKRIDSNDPTQRDIYDHPAFGVIRLNNSHGGGVTLLGSDLKHNDYITLEIAPAELHRSYGENHVFGTRIPIIKVAITHANFIALSQSVGNSQGVPVTIHHAPSTLNKDVVVFPDIDPLDSSLEMSKDELEHQLKHHVDNALKALSELTEAVKAKRTGKALLELVNTAENQISLLPSNLSSSISFAKDVMDKTAHEAETNARASIQMRITEIGIKSIEGDTTKLMQVSDTPLIEGIKSVEDKDGQNEK